MEKGSNMHLASGLPYSKSAGGTVSASCSSKGATATGSFSFLIG